LEINSLFKDVYNFCGKHTSIKQSSGGFAVPTYLVLPFVFSPFLVLSLMILLSGKS